MDLKWSLFTRELRPHPQLRVKLQQKLGKLAQQVEAAGLRPDVVHLKVSLEKHEKKKWFRAALALKTPACVLRTERFGNDPMPAFEQALRALARDFSKSKDDPSAEGDQEQDRPTNRSNPRTSLGLSSAASAAV
jgi:ribosome-associated translation inhibitor RaiA